MKISSPMTPLVKFGWPIGWIGLMGYFNVAATVRPELIRWGPGVSSVAGRALLAVLLLFGLITAIRLCLPLKSVWLTADGLRVVELPEEARS